MENKKNADIYPTDNDVSWEEFKFKKSSLLTILCHRVNPEQ